MYRSESKEKLLPSSEETCWFGESEGSSSGYDSASDSSGDESSFPTKTEIKDEVVPKIMRYSSTNALTNSLQLILSMPEMCDVKFLVGPKSVAVYGVKAILSSRSKAIYKIIMKAQQEQEVQKRNKKSSKRHIVIKVKKYQPEDFRKIIEFLHCGKVGITKSCLAGLYCGAVQFGLSDLYTACVDYLSKKSLSTHLNDFVECAGNYIQHSAYGRYYELVKDIFAAKEQDVIKSGMMETQI